MFGNGFYNPYTYQPYYQATNMNRNLGGLARINTTGGVGKTGLAGLLSKFSFSGFLNGASKTLNVVNQAIPVFYQVRPIINNARTMFRIMSAVKDDNNSKGTTTNRTRNNSISTNTSTKPSLRNSTQNPTTSEIETSSENPVFFI